MTGAPAVRLNAMGGGVASLHATAVAVNGAALAICGPAGSGKSGCAAMMLALGARLVADDLCILRREGARVVVARPHAAPAAMELRGIGIVPVDGVDRAPLRGVLLLKDSTARLPEGQTISLLDRPVPLLRHPYRFDVAAKATAWLRSRRVAADHD